MNYVLAYLEKHSHVNPFLMVAPPDGLKYIVTIPAYLETRLLESLESLYSCIPPKGIVEVIIAVNWPENELQENIEISQRILKQLEGWIKDHASEWIRFYPLVLKNVVTRKAGVGYARKTAMDEAIRRFNQAGQEDGIIISFDADSTCDPDYFTGIESYFSLNPLSDGCVIYFEHPVYGTDFPLEVYKGITQYELHLRYYLHSLRNTGFPNAFYTLGSAFAVRAKTYCKQGGMNIRKAGEDFYFLQKLFDLGSFNELNTTRVIPSPRPSVRVPFGTGAAITKFLKHQQPLLSYNPASFDALKVFFQKLPLLYKAESERIITSISDLDISILSYLKPLDFAKVIHEINCNCSDFHSFKKRFYRYFNMFRILKYLNFAKKTYPDLPVTECALIFLKKNLQFQDISQDPGDLLSVFRRMDRKTIFRQ